MSDTSLISRAELDALLAASKDPDAARASVLPRLDAIHRTACALLTQVQAGSEDAPDECEALIQALRVLRNACAIGAAAAAAALLALDAPDLLAGVVDALGGGAAALNWTLPTVAAQLLANFVNGSPDCAAAAWARLFPSQFTALAHVDSCPAHEALSLALLTCCRGVEGAAAALAGPDGAPALTAMLHANCARFAPRGECNATIPLLLGNLVFIHDALPPLAAALASSGEAVQAAPPEGGWTPQAAATLTAASPVAAHSLLLQELAAEAQDAPAAAAVTGGGSVGGRAGASMACLLDLFCALAAAENARILNKSDDNEAAAAGASARAQLLQDALHLIRDVAARDDDGAGIAEGASLVEELMASGLVPALPAALKALGPIENPRRDAPAAPLADLSPGLAAAAAAFTTTQPYEGYRSDLLAALGNAAHGRRRVAAAVEAVGGVELVLAQCQVDDKSPLAREWALWAVRNLCEGSEAARDAIAALKTCGVTDGEELRAAGVRVTLDEATGKLKVSKREEEGDSRRG